MIDPISREKALDALNYEMKYGAEIDRCGLDTAYNIITNIPSVEPEQKWIPVTEKLPKDDETVLITHKGGVSFGWYNGRYWERGASTKHRPLQTVIAWMQLPESYK